MYHLSQCLKGDAIPHDINFNIRATTAPFALYLDCGPLTSSRVRAQASPPPEPGPRCFLGSVPLSYRLLPPLHVQQLRVPCKNPMVPWRGREYTACTISELSGYISSDRGEIHFGSGTTTKKKTSCSKALLPGNTLHVTGRRTRQAVPVTICDPVMTPRAHSISKMYHENSTCTIMRWKYCTAANSPKLVLCKLPSDM